MKIQGNTPRVEDVTPARQTGPATKPPHPAQKSDDVDISSRAREAMRIMEAVKRAPDVREDRVRELREAIESGTYRVEGKDVAEKLMKESMLGSIL